MGQNGTKVQVQEFLGFCNYYRHFINHYSDIAKPLTSLTGNVEYKWGPEQDKEFHTLQRAVTTAPLLKHFNRGLPTRLETEAFNQAVAGVLEQQHGDPWHLVEYYSSTLTQPQRNWPIHDKELWGIVSSIDRWRPILAGVPFDIYMDHQALKYLFTKHRLNTRQAE